MKKIIFFFTLCLFAISCSDKEDTPTVKELKIVADKVQATADGVDKVVFTVTLNKEDVTAKSLIKIDNNAIQGKEFVSTTPGTFTVTATYENITSKPIEVIFNKKNINSVVLQASKNEIVGDGVDEITFTVIADGDDVTTAAAIHINDVEVTETKFTSLVPGTYSATATYEGVSSEPVELIVTKPLNTVITLKASKKVIVADGIDLIELSALSSSEAFAEDITNTTTFYVNGTALNGNLFKTSTSGVYTVTASTETANIDDEIEINAQTDFVATQKVYFELFAATWCPWCPAGMIMLNELVKDSRVVGMEVHPRNNTTNPDPYIEETTGFSLYTFSGATGVPTVMVDRNKGQLLKYAELSTSTAESLISTYLKTTAANVGIAIESKLVDGKIEAKTHIRSTGSMSDVKFVGLLIENKLAHDQANLHKPELGNPITNFEHNSIYRKSYNSKILGEGFTLTANTPVEKTFSFTPESKYVIDNCEIIILITNNSDQVLNVQKVKVGGAIGY